jgi:hypothetical protein
MLGHFRWFILSLAGIVAATAIVIWHPSNQVRARSAIVGIFVMLPLAIVTYRDGIRRLGTATPDRRRQLLFLSMPIRILGAIAFTLGVLMIFSLVYNLIAGTLPDDGPSATAARVLLLVFGVSFTGVGWRWLRRPLAWRDSLPAYNVTAHRPAQDD